MSQRKAFAIMSGIFLASTALYVACGNDSSSSEVPSDDGGADGTTADTGGGGNDSGGGTDTGTGSETSTTDSGGNQDAGDAGATDAGGDAQLIVDSGGVITDAGPGGDGAVLNCGTAQCDLPSQTCCIYPLQGTSPFYSACSGGATCPTLDAGLDAGSAVELRCESQANCPTDQVCCLSSPSSGSTSSHCVAAGSCTSTAGNKTALLCDRTEADAGCHDAGACSGTNIGTWGLPSGFSTCGGVAK